MDTIEKAKQILEQKIMETSAKVKNVGVRAFNNIAEIGNSIAESTSLVKSLMPKVGLVNSSTAVATNLETTIIISLADSLDDDMRLIQNKYEQVTALVKKIKENPASSTFEFNLKQLDAMFSNTIKIVQKKDKKSSEHPNIKNLQIVLDEGKMKIVALNSTTMVVEKIESDLIKTPRPEIYYIKADELEKIIQAVNEYITVMKLPEIFCKLTFCITTERELTDVNNKSDEGELFNYSHIVIEAPQLVIHTATKKNFQFPAAETLIPEKMNYLSLVDTEEVKKILKNLSPQKGEEKNFLYNESFGVKDVVIAMDVFRDRVSLSLVLSDQSISDIRYSLPLQKSKDYPGYVDLLSETEKLETKFVNRKYFLDAVANLYSDKMYLEVSENPEERIVIRSMGDSSEKLKTFVMVMPTRRR